MVVLIDKIQSPTMIQKGGNYIFLHTYTFTIDIVPLVLENYYFTGLIVEYKGIIVKMRLQTKRKAESAQRNKEMPTFTTKPRPSTNVGGAPA